VTIRVSIWDTGNAGLKPYQVGIKAFEAANPGIKMVMFFFAQRLFIRGIVMSGFKG
jgi:ABC-type glycerol-3-phosphate transport system substrate-binding protein